MHSRSAGSIGGRDGPSLSVHSLCQPPEFSLLLVGAVTGKKGLGPSPPETPHAMMGACFRGNVWERPSGRSPLLDTKGWCSSEREASGQAGGPEGAESVCCVSHRSVGMAEVCARQGFYTGNAQCMYFFFLRWLVYQTFLPRIPISLKPKGSGKLSWAYGEVGCMQW